MEQFDEAFWDERYRSRDSNWSGNPNAQLVKEASGLAPGTALDAGCGEGADAVWLAQEGWHVTATDISGVALQRAAARALQLDTEVADRITWLRADLVDWNPDGAAYDLVSAQYVHVPTAQQDAVYRRLAEAVKPGGTLLVVGHHPSDPHTLAAGPDAHELTFTSDHIARLLDRQAWEIVVSEGRERQRMDPHGRAVTMHDAVLRARRPR